MSAVLLDGKALSARMRERLRQEAAARQVRLLGPAPAPLAVLRGRKRYYCLLKGQDWTPLRQIYFAALAAPESRHLRIFLDLNPVNML